VWTKEMAATHREFELMRNDCATDLEKRPNGNLYLIDSQGKNWSRGRELNSRPADYEFD
jgi:hypothetical protein